MGVQPFARIDTAHNEMSGEHCHIAVWQDIFANCVCTVWESVVNESVRKFEVIESRNAFPVAVK